MKKNLFKEMLKKQEKHEIEVGSKEEWILQWLDVAEDYDRYEIHDDEWEDFSHYDNLYSILECCEDLDEMQNEIICYSFTDEEYNGEWKYDRIKDYYDLDDDNRDRMIDWLKYMESDYDYFKKINCERRYIVDQMIGKFRTLFTEYYIDKDQFREFRSIFEKFGNFYDDKEWSIFYMEVEKVDRQKELFERNMAELKKADIDFKFSTWNYDD